MNRLGDKLDLSALTVAEAVKDAEIYNDDVIKFLHTPVSSQLIEHPICNFVFDAVFHKTHPLAAQKVVTAVDLAQFPIIALYQGQIGRTRQDEFLNHRI